MIKKMTIQTSCVSAEGSDIYEMTQAARPVKLSTFRRHCDCAGLEKTLGYDKRFMKLKNDSYVDFFKSHYRGAPCYYLRHSAIEYVFTN